MRNFFDVVDEIICHCSPALEYLLSYHVSLSVDKILQLTSGLLILRTVANEDCGSEGTNKLFNCNEQMNMCVYIAA